MEMKMKLVQLCERILEKHQEKALLNGWQAIWDPREQHWIINHLVRPLNVWYVSGKSLGVKPGGWGTEEVYKVINYIINKKVRPGSDILWTGDLEDIEVDEDDSYKPISRLSVVA